MIELLLAPGCVAEVITHCDTHCWSTSYYQAFYVAPRWPNGLAKQLPRGQLGCMKCIIKDVKVLPSASTSYGCTSLRKCFHFFCFVILLDILVDHYCLISSEVLSENTHNMKTNVIPLLMLYLLRYKLSGLSVINNWGYSISYIFPHSCCLPFFLDTSYYKLEIKCTQRTGGKQTCTDLKLLCLPTAMLSKSVFFSSLHASDYITTTLALWRQKLLSELSRLIWAWSRKS